MSSEVELPMRLIQARVTPQGTYAEFVSAETEGPHREAFLRLTIAPDELDSLDFARPFVVVLGEEAPGE